MDEKLAKFSASRAADEALDRMVKKSNEDFQAGKVTKTQMLSWIIINFEANSFERCVDKIQSAHFDDVAYLDSVVQQMKASRKNGETGKDILTLLAPLTNGKKKA